MRRHIKHRGAALWLTVLATLMLLTYFVGSVMSSARSQAGITTKELGERQAHYAALGAVNLAIIELENNPAWDGSWDYQPMPQSDEVFHSLKTDKSYPGLGSGEIYLVAQGFTSQHGAGTPLAGVAGTAYRPGGGVQHALFADERLELMNCQVDAYNAALGIGYVPYPSPPPTPLPIPVTGVTPAYSGVPGAGAVGGNQSLQLSNSTVDGEVFLPQAGTVQNQGIQQGQGANLNKMGGSHQGTNQPKNRFDLPLIRAPFDKGSGVAVIDSGSWSSLPLLGPSDPGVRVLSPGAYRSVIVPDGGKLAFEPGEYYFEEGFYAISSASRIELKLSNENTLTKLFVGGAFRLRGVDFRPVDSGDTSVSPPTDVPATIIEPAPLRVYGAGLEDSGQMVCEVSMRDTNFSGLVIGEAIEAEIQNSEMWGAVMARSIEAQTVRIHYDTGLASIELANHSRWRLRGLTQEFIP